MSLDATPYTVILGLGVMIFLLMTVPNPGRGGFTNIGLVGSIRPVLIVVATIPLLTIALVGLLPGRRLKKVP